MELIWLEDFLALAALGNFSRAAEARGVTQPAFSRRIRALETWLGVELFDRSATGVELTAGGQIFRPGAEEIVRRVRQIAQEVRESERKLAATLSFAATHALSFTFFPGWMRDLEVDGPLGPLRLISDNMQACETLMLRGDAQFLLCHHRTEAPSRFNPTHFRSVVIGQDVLQPYSAPDADGRPLWSLDDDTPKTPYLAYNPESGLGRILHATVFSERRVPALETVFTSHLAATLLSMARDGRGLCWLPEALAADDFAAGRLVPATTKIAWSASLDVRLFRPASRQSAAAETFWSRIQSRVSKTGHGLQEGTRNQVA
ncbi:LysR family transcriptional regulator [Brevundimonas sp. SL161]|uniref:LysR family transcriptional regulator n=1 Tax=Brevundimonas sp. SL161 TaxID=2804613 RepID=UPI003CEC1FD8